MNMATPAPAAAGKDLVLVEGLKVHFPVTSGIVVQRRVGAVYAVDGLTFDIAGARRWASSASPAAASPLGPRHPAAREPTAG